ncbi:hypothetical protein OS493_003466 [Desmophyllum pertusum]|uniref:Uncharacterized protein n=1 Tax=Desmophyllum pertusum TaxID=174260 RepID=A0A9X0A647_9CNID|nr:hypothetical protein OS493_003466 [Desmophyllum pertusum]
MLDIELKCTGEVAIFKWNIPTLPTRGLLRCSPLIEKFNRKWRLLLTDKAVCLEYIQGVHPIHMHVSFIIKMPDGKAHANIVRGVNLAEGSMAKHTINVDAYSMRNITAKMEILEPELC